MFWRMRGEVGEERELVVKGNGMGTEETAEVDLDAQGKLVESEVLGPA